MCDTALEDELVLSDDNGEADQMLKNEAIEGIRQIIQGKMTDRSLDDQRGVLAEIDHNVKSYAVILNDPIKVTPVTVDFLPLKERVHFFKTKECKKKYKHMGSNEKIVENVLCKICDKVIDDGKECKKGKQMFGNDCQSSSNLGPFECGGKNDDLICQKRKINYILSKIHFKCMNYERGGTEFFVHKDLKVHENECKFRALICEFGKDAVLSANYTEHVDYCKKMHAQIEGNYGKTLMDYSEIDTHIQEGRMKPLHCDNFPKCIYSGSDIQLKLHTPNCAAIEDKCEFGGKTLNDERNIETDNTNAATHDGLFTLNDIIRSTIRNTELSKDRLERRKEERDLIKAQMDNLLTVLTQKQSICDRLKTELRQYKDEVFKVKKRRQKELLKTNDGTLQDEGEDFRIGTGKRPYICFAKNSEIDPLLAKLDKCKGADTAETRKLKAKNRDWVDGKCTTCSHILCKIGKYIGNGCKSALGPDGEVHGNKGFDFGCDKCECSCGTVKVKILRDVKTD